jgi:hypothetical protein
MNNGGKQAQAAREDDAMPPGWMNEDEAAEGDAAYEADLVEIERFLGVTSLDEHFREWLRWRLVDYSVDLEVAIGKVRWTEIAAQVEHFGKLARQLADKAAELEALIGDLRDVTESGPRTTERLGVLPELKSQGVDVGALAEQLKPLREATKYLSLVLEARDVGVDVILEQLKKPVTAAVERLKSKHLAVLLKAPAQDVTALVARLKAEAPLAAAALLQRPKYAGGRPSANWNWNKLMTSVADYYEQSTWMPATVIKDRTTGRYTGEFLKFATLIDRIAAERTGTAPTKAKTLGSRIERLLANRKDMSSRVSA